MNKNRSAGIYPFPSLYSLLLDTFKDYNLSKETTNLYTTFVHKFYTLAMHCVVLCIDCNYLKSTTRVKLRCII